MERQELEAQLRKRCPTIADDVIAVIEPCVVLEATRGEGQAGGTRFGGSPDVPAGFEWPSWKDGPLHFLCQIDLADVASAGLESDLPQEGLLSFFADPEAYGLSPDDKDGGRVFLFGRDQELEARSAPEGVEVHTEATVEMRLVPSIPRLEGLGIADAATDIEDEEAEAYWDLFDEFYDGLGVYPRHKLLGHADVIQHPPEEEVVQAIHGLHGPGAFDYDAWRRLEPEARDWRLLLQLGSDDDIDMLWGDVGTVFFVGRREALAKADFSDVWFNFQSH